MNTVGAGPRPARGLLPGGRTFKTPPSSGPSGRLLPLRGEGSRAAQCVAPTAENAPGAMAENTQAQAWSRTKSKFYKLRAQWPGRKRGTPLRFCAPEGFCQPQGISPVNGVLGGGEYGHEVSILSRSPSGSLVTFWACRFTMQVQQ